MKNSQLYEEAMNIDVYSFANHVSGVLRRSSRRVAALACGRYPKQNFTGHVIRNILRGSKRNLAILNWPDGGADV
jgi:hypothetical protein